MMRRLLALLILLLMAMTAGMQGARLSDEARKKLPGYFTGQSLVIFINLSL